LKINSKYQKKARRLKSVILVTQEADMGAMEAPGSLGREVHKTLFNQWLEEMAGTCQHY
jgi:hypothetical protein